MNKSQYQSILNKLEKQDTAIPSTYDNISIGNFTNTRPTDLENFYTQNRIRQADSVNSIYNDPKYASTILNSSIPLNQLEKNIEQSKGATLEPYNKSITDYLKQGASYVGEKVGLNNYQANKFGRQMFGDRGSDQFSKNIGFMDIVPAFKGMHMASIPMIPAYLNEAYRAFDRGDNVGGAIEGTAALAEGVFLGKPIAKSLKALSKSLSSKIKGDPSKKMSELASEIQKNQKKLGALPSNKVMANTKLQAPSMAMVNPRKVDDLGFFYKSEEIANSMQQNKGSGAQFLAFFKNKGVKDSELYDTGLEELFKRDKVTKKDILDNIDLNRLKLQERTYSGSDVSSNLIFEDVTKKLEYKTPEFNKYSQDEIDKLNEGLNVSDDVRAETELVSTRVLEDTKTGYKIVYDENGENFLTYRPNTDIFDIEQSEQARALMDEHETLEGFRFDEIAQKGNINEATIATEGIAINNGDFISTDARFADSTQKGGTNYKEYVIRRQSFNPTMAMNNDYVKPDDFQNPVHYDDFNPIFHVRTKDRNTTDGGKTLYTEELQSDRGQQGRKYGFSSGKNFDETVAKYKELNDSLVKNMSDIPVKLKAAEQEYLYKLKNPGKPPIRIPLRSDLSGDELNYYAKLSDRARPLNDEYLDFNASRMPDEYKTMKLTDYIDFMGDPDYPLEADIDVLGMMKIINKERRYPLGRDDLDGFPPKMADLSEGARLNRLRSALKDIRYERYDLTNTQFDDLDTFAGFADDLRNDLAETYNKLQGNVPGGDLVDTTEDWTRLGIKRLLQKAVQGNYDSVTFSPGQIQVDRWGNPKLKDYYDNIIPKMAKEVAGKKNVGIKEVEIAPNDFHTIFMRGSTAEDRRYFVSRIGTDRPIAGFDRLEDAQKYAENLDSIEKQKSVAITITPELREKVLKGLSLFTMGGAVLGLEEQMGALGDIPSTQGDET